MGRLILLTTAVSSTLIALGNDRRWVDGPTAFTRGTALPFNSFLLKTEALGNTGDPTTEDLKEKI